MCLMLCFKMSCIKERQTNQTLINQRLRLKIMLKGIKKSKPNEEQSATNVNEVQKKHTSTVIEGWGNDRPDEIRDQQIKVFTSNQNSLKQQFMIEEQNQVEQNIVEQKTSAKNNQLSNIELLRAKALEIMQLYQSGDIQQLENQLQIFQKLQKAYYLSQSTQRKQYTPGQSDPTQQKLITQPNQQQKKGRFEYNFNYQQSDQEVNRQKNPKKRTHKSRPIMKSNKIQDYCIYCPDNQQLRLISASNYVYLAIPKRKTFHKYSHFILAPVEHQHTSIGLNQDVLTQLSNYKKCLLQMFDKKNYLVVFWQQFSQQNSHIYIQCLAVPHSKGQDFPFFFKQSLDTIQGNWTTHQSLIKIEKQKGGLQKQIPKKINYFYIDFSLGYGYAHVIENPRFWKREFVYDIVATALGIQLYEVKTAAEFTDQELNTKENEFRKIWEPYDWTKCL